jgi:hypothetical protein
MKNPTVRTLKSPRLFALIAAAPICGLLAINAHASDRFDESSRREGTWRVDVTLYNCSTGVESPAFKSFLTFGAEGTLVETTANAAFQPGQRSPGHGEWYRTGRGRYFAASEAFILFNSDAHPPVPAFHRGSQRIEQGIEMQGRNAFTSDATVYFYDEGGTVLGSACASAKAKRF